jgi:hypothetical protein
MAFALSVEIGGGTTIAPFRPHERPLPEAINPCKAAEIWVRVQGSHSFGGEDRRLCLFCSRGEKYRHNGGTAFAPPTRRGAVWNDGQLETEEAR